MTFRNAQDHGPLVSHAAACPRCLSHARRRALAFSGQHLHVLWLLVEAADGTGHAAPSHAALAKATGLPVEQVEAVLDDLSDSNTITATGGKVGSRDGGWRAIWSFVPFCRIEENR